MAYIEIKCENCGAMNKVEESNESPICRICIQPLNRTKQSVVRVDRKTPVEQQLEYGYRTGNPEHFRNVLEMEPGQPLAEMGLEFFALVDRARANEASSEDFEKLDDMLKRLLDIENYSNAEALKLAMKRIEQAKSAL